MRTAERFVNGVIKIIVRLLMKIDYREFERIPRNGPGLLISNHTSNIEGPLLFVLSRPRPMSGLAKRELWGNPVTRFLMQTWGLIPVTRGKLDSKALRKAESALANRKILGIAPEGTRSRDGVLQQGKPGAALLAYHNNCEIIPMVQWGIGDLLRNVRRFKRTPVGIRVGEPFSLRQTGTRPSRTDLRQMADEIMFQLAVLLPERFRGEYRDLTRMTTDFIIRS